MNPHDPPNQTTVYDCGCPTSLPEHQLRPGCPQYPTTLRDALATALWEQHWWLDGERGGFRAPREADYDAILAHPAMQAWLRGQDAALVALADGLDWSRYDDAIEAFAPLTDHAAAIAAARERLR